MELCCGLHKHGENDGVHCMLVLLYHFSLVSYYMGINSCLFDSWPC